MDQPKKIKIEIAGSNYTVMTTEQEGYVHDLAAEISGDIAALDEKLNEHAYIVPGLGDAGDRIFGTK